MKTKSRTLVCAGVAALGAAMLPACGGEGSKPNPALPRQTAPQSSANSPQPAKGEKTDAWESEAAAQPDGAEFLRVHLSDLMAIKGEPTSKEYGFGQGGPHYQWLSEVQAEHRAKRFGRRERIAVGHLLLLGLEYVKTKGEENDYTRFARQQVEEAIREK